MKKTLLAASLALIGAAQAAEITIYKQPSFSGGDQTFSRDMTTLQGTGVFDQSNPAMISASWPPPMRNACFSAVSDKPTVIWPGHGACW